VRCRSLLLQLLVLVMARPQQPLLLLPLLSGMLRQLAMPP
jgi:hypothetical protein